MFAFHYAARMVIMQVAASFTRDRDMHRISQMHDMTPQQ